MTSVLIKTQLQKLRRTSHSKPYLARFRQMKRNIFKPIKVFSKADINSPRRVKAHSQ